MKHSSSAHLNPLASEGGAGLDLPHAIPDGVQIETLCDLGSWGGGQEVLFVCKDQHRNTAQLLLIQQLSQLLQRTHRHTHLSATQHDRHTLTQPEGTSTVL